MSRKLIHSVRAFAVSFGIFAVAIAIGIPISADIAGAEATSDLEIATSAGLTEATNLVPDASLPSSAPTKPRLRRREAREIALPFFSFAHVLRRGNGS